MDRSQLRQALQEAGIVGAGGAGFPTYGKIDSRVNTVLLNCAECEPLLKLHQLLLQKYARQIMKAFQMIIEAVEADEAIICIKEEYHAVHEAVLQYIEEFPKMRVHPLDSVYPAGDEMVMIYEATGKVVKPGSVPVDEGIAVFNVETVYNIYRAVERKWPVADKVITLAGEVETPVTVRVPVGIALKDAVKLAGKITTENPVYWMNGPMMGRIGSPEEPVKKTTNAIIILPKGHSLTLKKEVNPSIALKRASSACCQCRTCTDKCPRNALGYPVEPHQFMRAAANRDFQDAQVYVNTLYCNLCGICEMYACPQGLSPRSLMSEYKTGLRKAGMEPPKEAEQAPVRKSRDLHKVVTKRLLARLGLGRYSKDTPFLEEAVPVRQVKILLLQHLGVPAIPCVAGGEEVRAGQMIGKPGEGLSAAVHASIDGRVAAVTETYILISKE